MVNTLIVLLKRSDGPYYKIHNGDIYDTDFEKMAASFNDFEFTVSPILIAIHKAEIDIAIDMAVIEATQDMPEMNGWFKSDFDTAARILYETIDLQTLGLSPRKTIRFDFDLYFEQGGTGQAGETGGTEHAEETEEMMDTESEEATKVWEHLEPCTTAQDANTAAEIRRNLINKLGKTVAKQILNSCVTTVAKTSNGNKNRVLKANGKLLKLKHASF